MGDFLDSDYLGLRRKNAKAQIRKYFKFRILRAAFSQVRSHDHTRNYAFHLTGIYRVPKKNRLSDHSRYHGRIIKWT